MNKYFSKIFSWLVILALMLTAVPVSPVFAATPVFINEIHYDNTGTDAGEAVEIAGPAGTDLTGWSIVLYNGSTGAVYDTDILSGSIPDQGGGFGTMVLNYPVNGIQNGAPDGIALVDASSTVVQFLSYEGTFTAVGGPANGMVSTDIGVSELGSEPVGNSLQLTGTGTDYEDFTWVNEAPNTFGSINTGQSFGGPTNPTGVGSANPNLLALNDSTLLTVAVTPGTDPTSTGLAVSCDLSSIGGSATQMFFDDGTYGDETAGDNTFSYMATVGAGTVTSINNLACAISDAESRSGSASISLSVILPIGTVQGTVGDTDDGLTHRSPYAPPSGNSTGQTVAVQGVITQKTLARTSSGGSQNGFFLQNTAAIADGDPNSSDGIFVFMGGFTDLIGGYVPQVGDEVVIQARVSEFFFLTELSSARALVVVRSGVDLEAELPAFDVNPPDNLADANRYWERHEGMRAQVPANSIVIDSRDVFASTADGEFWLARGDHPIAQRSDPYARRAFRDPHPQDNDPALFDDGNGYRIILGSLGIKAAVSDNTALITPARTYDTMTNAPVGGVYFSFSKYQIMVEQQPVLTPGVDPALNAPPQTFNRMAEYSLAPYNVENLYDRRDDPFDGCDFTGNPGCPGVNPPFDYVPASEAVYQAHLNDIAQQIISDLHGPDIIFVQEAEDQDICTMSAGALACGTTNNADGKPDTLQELTTVIASLGGPAYDAVYNRNGADDRGIVSAFLFRSDRVELLPASASDPVLGSSPTVVYRSPGLAYNTDVSNPKALNAVLPGDVDTSTGTDGSNVFTRPPQVGLFRIWKDVIGSGTYVDLYALSNHFSSTPDARVGQRQEQAKYAAAIVAALQAANPEVKVAVAGDFNVYPRPDDPFAPGHPRYPSDQLGGLYNQGLLNLYDILVAEVPVAAFSYVFQGQTQTLDQIFVTGSLFDELVQARAAHVNADWPADFDGDGPRGASDHDPLVARFCRDVTPPTITASVLPNVLWPPNHKYVTVNATVSVSDDADPNPVLKVDSVVSNEPDDAPGDEDGNTTDDIVVEDDFTFQLRAERSELGAGRTYTITYQATDSCGNTTLASVTVFVPHDQGE
jgi:predicted extracellular nuclease